VVASSDKELLIKAVQQAGKKALQVRGGVCVTQ
jgi:hypothetical protein